MLRTISVMFFTGLLLAASFAFAGTFKVADDISDDNLAAVSTKLYYYAQVVNDMRSMKFIEAVAERIRATDNMDQTKGRPVALQQSDGFGARFDRAMQDNAKEALRMEPMDGYMDEVAGLYPYLLGKLKAFDRYYQRGDYQDDHHTKGLLLAEEMRAGLVLLLNLQEKMTEEFDRLAADYELVSLERFEKQHGKKLFWLHSRVMQQAAKMLPLAPPDLNDFDVQAFWAEWEKFRTIADEYEEYVDAAGDNLRNECSYKIKDDWINNYIKVGRTMMNAYESNSPNLYASHVPILYNYYNSMATDSNSASFKEPKGYPRKAVRLKYLEKDDD